MWNATLQEPHSAPVTTPVNILDSLAVSLIAFASLSYDKVHGIDTVSYATVWQLAGGFMFIIPPYHRRGANDTLQD